LRPVAFKGREIPFYRYFQSISGMEYLAIAGNPLL
jgi:hypothetical protein